MKTGLQAGGREGQISAPLDLPEFSALIRPNFAAF